MMKGREKKYCLIFLLLAVFCLIFTQNPRAYAQIDRYDFRKDGETYQTLKASDILSDLFEDNISSVEKAYLDQNDEFSLRYDNRIPSSCIDAEYFSEDESVKINADNYKYIALTGKEVVWRPINAYIDENEYKLNNGYLLSQVGKSDFVEVLYGAQFDVKAEDINMFINKTFKAAVSADQKLKSEESKYEAAYSQYLSTLEEYNKYLSDAEKYDNDKANYDKYLIQYKQWEKSRDEYNKYLKEYELYEAQKAEYESYDKRLEEYYRDLNLYQEYLSAYNRYLSDLESYQNSSVELQKVVYQLSVLSYIAKPATELNRTLKGAILGDSVTKVLVEKESLVTGGLTEKDIQRASDATVALRKLINQYLGLDTDEQRYGFYITCHKELSENFNELFRALAYFYNDFGLVRSAIDSMGKTRQFEILLAQLYYICNALDDEKIPNYIKMYKYTNVGAGYLDESYLIGDKTPLSILGKDGIIEDKGMAKPLDNGVPSLDIPTEPEKVDCPIPPTKVSAPKKPEPVIDPGDPPTEVKEPIEPQKVDKPEPPKQYEPTLTETSLVEALNANKLIERKPLNTDLTITVTTRIKKYFRNVKKAELRFFMSPQDETPTLTIFDAEYGSYIDYTGDIPQKEKMGYTCKFDYWMDEDGKRVNLDELDVEGMVNLFPHFSETPNLYDVIWIVDGKEISDQCYYGVSPIYDESKLGELLKPSDERNYRFLGWKKGEAFYEVNQKLPLMNAEPIAYEAVFESDFIIDWWIDGQKITTYAWPGEVPSLNTVPHKEGDAFKKYIFEGWDKDIVAADTDASYTARFKAEYYAYNNNGYVSIETKNECLVANCIDICTDGEPILIYNLLELAVNNGLPIRVIFDGIIADFDISVVSSAFKSKAYFLKANLESLPKNAYRITFLMTDADGNSALDQECVSLTILRNFNKENTSLATEQGEEIDFSIINDGLSFSASIGTYFARTKFSIATIPNEYASIETDLVSAEEGMTVQINATPNIGMQILKVYCVTASGDEIEVINNRFIMPDSSVIVGVVCDFLQFNVIFKSDGKIIYAKKVKYGSTVNPPPAPLKASDGKYDYEFVGWDRELGIITCDTVFNAVYTSSLSSDANLGESKLNIIVIIVRTVVPISLAILVICIMIFTTKRVLKRNKK